jgi:hypothetical protein
MSEHPLLGFVDPGRDRLDKPYASPTLSFPIENVRPTEKSVRQKPIFANAINLICPVQPFFENISLPSSGKSVGLIRASHPNEGRCARHETLR